MRVALEIETQKIERLVSREFETGHAFAKQLAGREFDNLGASDSASSCGNTIFANDLCRHRIQSEP